MLKLNLQIWSLEASAHSLKTSLNLTSDMLTGLQTSPEQLVSDEELFMPGAGNTA